MLLVLLLPLAVPDAPLVPSTLFVLRCGVIVVVAADVVARNDDSMFALPMLPGLAHAERALPVVAGRARIIDISNTGMP